ncbi:MAG: endolytic transglycosylase MltG [Alphaproteobacteria bacterium]
MTLPQTPFRKHAGLPHRLAQGVSLVVLIALLSPLVGAAALFMPGPLAQDTTVVVAHGASSADIGAQLVQGKAIYLSSLFRVGARIVASNSLKAGEYMIPARASVMDIALMMHEGRSVSRLFKVPEGLTSAEIVRLLKSDPTLVGTIDAAPAEGSLLPESYRYSYGDDRAHMIARMQKAMQDELNEIWAGRDDGLPLKSPADAVTLASIVEKETGKAQERPRIAGVFYNRLRLNMRLQSDPTVIYALTNGQETLARTLTHDDLSFASPFNTYTSDGLPPQPICNPGSAALKAVAHPEHNNYLYFVADGSGGHAFAADLAKHDENINHWHQIENAGHK